MAADGSTFPDPLPPICVVIDATSSVTLINGSTPEGRDALRGWSAPRPGERKPPYSLSADLAAFQAAAGFVRPEPSDRFVLRAAGEDRP